MRYVGSASVNYNTGASINIKGKVTDYIKITKDDIFIKDLSITNYRLWVDEYDWGGWLTWFTNNSSNPYSYDGSTGIISFSNAGYKVSVKGTIYPTTSFNVYVYNHK